MTPSRAELEAVAAAYGMPVPKFATLRDPSSPTRGTRQAEFAAIWLASPLLPAQRYIVDVAGELLPNGRPRYPVVVVTFQRQGGKSHLSMARAGERCLSRRNFRVFYTAQTGGDAQDQFLKFADDVVKDKPLDRLVTVRRGNGKADMTFPNGSTIRPVPPGEGTGHGKQSDLYDVDEAWWFTEDQGKALMQAIGPTQLTRPDPQTWIWSAGGTAASTWLASYVARGRAGDPSIAYFEWGIPDDLALDDYEAIARHHPGYPHLVTADSIRKLRADIPDDNEFARAAGNRWTEVIGGAIKLTDWQQLGWAEPIPDGVPVAYGAARSADGTQAVLAAAANVGGFVVCEVLDVLAPFTAPQAIAEWVDGPVAVSRTGPSGPLYDALARLDVPELHGLTSTEEGVACSNVLDAVPTRAYRYRPHAALDAAVRVAGTRTIGDGGKAWARVSAGAPIAALDAVTAAIWQLDHLPAQGLPQVHFGGAA